WGNAGTGSMPFPVLAPLTLWLGRGKCRAMQPVSAFSPDTHSAADVVTALNLQPLDQEGGWFRRTAEAGLWVKPVETGEPRRAWSAIYALFPPEGFSALHRLAQDEIWCWHAGDTLESLRLGPETGSGGED